MNRSNQTPISDELLSAYIDGAVTNQERATVEAAISADPALAWELESLRRTVELVQALPPIALPRSFALREDQVADVLAERRAKAVAAATATAAPVVARPVTARPPRQPVAPPRRSFWQEFLAFFNSGNLLLRNATALAAVLFVVVLVTSPGATRQSGPALTSAPSTIKLQPDGPAQPVSQAEPAPAALEGSANSSVAESAAVAAEGAAPASAEAETAPAAQSVAPTAEVDPAAEAAPPIAEAVAMDAAPPGMDTGASAASMRAVPESRDAPVAKMMPAASGGGTESGPALFQAAPAILAPIGGEAAVGDIPASGELAQPMGVESETSPLAEPVAESAMDSAAADAPADAPVAEESPEAVAIQSEPAKVSEEPVAQESQASVASLEPDSTTPRLPWAYWGWLQAAVGGLVVLLGAFWLYTRKV